jgi:hypothetical protein
MKPNQKGIIGELEIVLDLTKQGYSVFGPYDEHGPIDLIAVSPDNKITRLQAKYKSLENDRIKVQLTTVHNGKVVHINRNAIDGYAIYCSDLNGVFYIPISVFGDQSSKNFTIDDISKYTYMF